MTRRSIVVSVAAVAAAAVFFAGLAAGGPGAKPKLRVIGLEPFVVAGTGFRAGEIVRVTIAGSSFEPAFKRRAASDAGDFVVTFRGVRAGECSYYFVTASGNEGSRAALRSVPRACAIERGRVP